jgi:menaquinone-dependent protoporphyrinogen oxidase
MKVLVVYGSKRGGTAGLAQMIGDSFARREWSVEVRDAALDVPLGDPDIVVIGGALYANRWHRDARRFVRRHRAMLARIPTWLFSSGPLDDSARPGDVAAVTQVQSLAQQIEASGHMTFGGRLLPAPKGFIAKAMAKKYAGDWRDPGQVEEWVHQICHTMAPPVIVLPDAAAAAIPSQRAAEHDEPVATAGAKTRRPKASPLA